VWSCEREEGGPGCRSEVTLKSRYRGHCTGVCNTEGSRIRPESKFRYSFGTKRRMRRQPLRRIVSTSMKLRPDIDTR
jgi:hypothetical protein